MNEADHDVVVIGGGQAGLAVAYYLRRAGIDFLVLDAEDRPGGAWLHAWASLRLFSPATYSSLPGWPMPPSRSDGFPTRDEVIDYLTRYEQRYAFPIERSCHVETVERDRERLYLQLRDGRTVTARAVVSAAGTWSAPYIRARNTEFLQRAPWRQVRMLDQMDDCKLLGCGVSHSSSPPSAIMLMEWLVPPSWRIIAQDQSSKKEQSNADRNFGYRPWKEQLQLGRLRYHWASCDASAHEARRPYKFGLEPASLCCCNGGLWWSSSSRASVSETGS